MTCVTNCSKPLARKSVKSVKGNSVACAQGTPEENVGLFCQLARESGSAALAEEKEPVLVA